MRLRARNMNQWLVSVLPAFIVVASCHRTTCEAFAPKADSKDADTKPTADKFPYVVHSKSNKSCTLADMAIDITIPIPPKDKDASESSERVLQVPRNAKADGTCSSTISELKLTWKEEKGDTNVIRFTLINDHTSFSVFSISMNISLNATTSDNAKEKGGWYNATSGIDLHLFAASTTNEIYKCNETRTIQMKDAKMQIGNVSLIAFNTGTDISSRTEKGCTQKEDKTFPYISRDSQQNICAFARMTISLNVSYMTKELKKKIATVSVPTDARVEGKCDSATSIMEFIWTAKPKQEFALDKTENSLMLGFVKDKKHSYLRYSIASIYMDEKTFSDAAIQGDRLTVAPRFEENLFLAPAKNGLYSCSKEITLNASDAKITVSDVLLVAFDPGEELLSKKVSDCTLTEEGFKYRVNDPKTTVACILANMDIDVNVSYKKSNKSQGTGSFTVPQEKVRVSGTCGSKRSELIISWKATEDEKTTSSIAFRIANNSTFFFVHEIEARIYMNETIFPDAEEKNTMKNGTTEYGLQLFRAPATSGVYKCPTLTEQVKADDIGISISDVAFIAFNTDENLDSREVQFCSNHPANDTTSSTTQATTSTTQETPSTTQSSSTTEPSSTTTSPAPTVAPTPEPDPSVKDYHYVVTNSETHVACIVANMEISIKIPYKTKDNKMKENTLNVPATAKTTGKCEDTSSTMELSWPAGEAKDNPKYETEQQNVVTFSFKKSESTYSVNAVGVTIYLDGKQFPEAAETQYNAKVDNITAFSASLKNFYKCDRGTSMKVKEAGLTVSKVKLTAFNTEKSVAKRSEENCAVEEEGADVGAIVGGIIGGIILIAVIVAAIMMYRKRRGGM